MFQNFTSALLEKISHFLLKNPDFIGLSKADREKALEKLTIPKAFKDYLLEVKEKELMSDFALAVHYAQGGEDNLQENKFFTAMLHFLTEDLALKIDHLDSDYYLLASADRQKVVDKLISSDSQLAQSLKSLLLNRTYQQLSSAINKLAKKVQDAAFVLVQSPREMNSELRREVRKKLAAENPYSLPTFQINHKLIGGLRVFKNGESIDQSWLGRVLAFTNITA